MLPGRGRSDGGREGRGGTGRRTRSDTHSGDGNVLRHDSVLIELDAFDETSMAAWSRTVLSGEGLSYGSKGGRSWSSHHRSPPEFCVRPASETDHDSMNIM